MTNLQVVTWPVEKLTRGRAFERVEDRRRVEEHLGDDDPDDRDVAEAHVERPRAAC